MGINAIVDELLSAYAELRRSLSRRLRNPQDAADVAQSSFERVYVHALAAAPITSPRALLFRTAQRICIDRARHETIVRDWARSHAVVAAGVAAPSVEQIVIHRQLIERVAERLAELPRRRREVFLLFRVFGCSRQEIATQLGISEAAVAKHVVRATVDCARCFVELRSR